MNADRRWDRRFTCPKCQGLKGFSKVGRISKKIDFFQIFRKHDKIILWNLVIFFIQNEWSFLQKYLKLWAYPSNPRYDFNPRSPRRPSVSRWICAAERVRLTVSCPVSGRQMKLYWTFFIWYLRVFVNKGTSIIQSTHGWFSSTYRYN